MDRGSELSLIHISIFLYKGPYDNLQAVYDTIYGKCLPEMECTLRDEASACLLYTSQ